MVPLLILAALALVGVACLVWAVVDEYRALPTVVDHITSGRSRGGAPVGTTTTRKELS